MKNIRATIFALAGLVAAALALSAAAAHAQSTRSWVSGAGSDANPCTRSAPCQTFAGAISRTAAGGEINCIDAGGFGALMITKAITIRCAVGEAGVLVSGTDGIIVNAGPNDAVHLSGLDIEGQGSGLSGVNIIQAGLVRIENSTVRGFTTAGVYVEPSAGGTTTVDVTDSVIADNSGTGILGRPGGGSIVRMLVERTTISQNTGDGLMANVTGTTGSLNLIVRGSTAVHNGGVGIVAYSRGMPANIMIDAGSATDNRFGLAANGTGAVIRFTRSSITGNNTGMLQLGSGAIFSYGNNSVDGNLSLGSFAAIAQQ